MHYYIDGYNLLFRLIRAGEELQKQRQRLIEDLEHAVKSIGLDVTIVFDNKCPLNEESRHHFRDLEIIFTGEGQSADDYIVAAIRRSKKPGEHTVVTSDNPLADRVRKQSGKTEPVESFLKYLQSRYRNKTTKKTIHHKQEPLIPTPPPTPGSIDHYLKSFKEPDPLPQKNRPLSDRERWLKAFEEGPSE